MREAAHNQGAGLLGLVPDSRAQLIAVVSHGDDSSDLPLLWQLCQTLVDLGYTCTVLDATQSESAGNPGLEQLLAHELPAALSVHAAPDWNVMPAALGVHLLAGPGGADAGAGLERLGTLFPSGDVLLLYAGVDTLVQLLAGCDLRPLLCVSNRRNSLLTSYVALKRLLRRAQLEPIILPMMDADTGTGKSLAECAKNYLGYEVNAFHVNAQGADLASAPLRQLATRLLEHALVLGTAPVPAWTGTPAQAAIARSH